MESLALRRQGEQQAGAMREPQPNTKSPVLTVELFGMPRVVAGTSKVIVHGDNLNTILAQVTEQHPELNEHILSSDGEWLNSGYTFVVDGDFTSDPDHNVQPESTVLLVSRASGG